ncbi:MAG TPA: PAS domain-containing sensor histidine kinase [Ferrovibrio sp.]|jgi:PAS domain S-box-containing protein|uniref:sensor histidine kinase n=1 Tax=Ferrovibrio sp. TaxID=1917215 RepID=UPI002ED2E22B
MVAPIAVIAIAAPLIVSATCLFVQRNLGEGRHLTFWAIGHAALAMSFLAITAMHAMPWHALPWQGVLIATAGAQFWAVSLAAGIRVLTGKPGRLSNSLLLALLLTAGITVAQHAGRSMTFGLSSAVAGAIVLYAGIELLLYRRSLLFSATGIVLIGRGALALFYALLFSSQNGNLDVALAISVFVNLLTGLGLIMIEFDNARARERKSRETEHATRLFLETVLETMPATMSYKDRDLRYRIINRQMRQFLRPYGDDLLGRTWSEIAGADAAAVVEEQDRQILATGEPRHMEQGWTDPNGRPIVIWALKMPLKDSTGAIQGIVTCGIDVTRLKDTETQLIEQREAAEAASRAKTAFLANMSHELRTPLNAIIGFAEMMSAGYLGQMSERQQDYARHIQQSGEHLLRLVNDILDLSRLESGRLELDINGCDFDRIAAAALAMVEPQAQRAEVALQFAPTHLTVRADERALTQILVNLLGNAVKFNRPSGRVELRADISDGVVRILVEDTGIGMSDAESLAARQPFHRVDAYRVRANSGAGLGLSICRSLAELHGGHLEISSEPGRGTRVEVALPA